MASATTPLQIHIAGGDTVSTYTDNTTFVNKTDELATVIFRESDFYIQLGSKKLLSFNGTQNVFFKKVDSCTLEYKIPSYQNFCLCVLLKRCEEEKQCFFEIDYLKSECRLIPLSESLKKDYKF